MSLVAPEMATTELAKGLREGVILDLPPANPKASAFPNVARPAVVLFLRCIEQDVDCGTSVRKSQCGRRAACGVTRNTGRPT